MGRQVWIFVAVFGGIGVVMLAGAIGVTTWTLAFRAEALRAPGTVVDIRSGSPVVEYVDADGGAHRITGRVSSNPPAYDIGESVTVRYLPSEPEAGRIDGRMETWFGPALLGLLGTVFTAVGGGFLIGEVRKRRLRSWLKQFGVPVQAKYSGVILDTSMRVNRRHPWRLTAQWQDPVTGIVRTFQSEMLFWDPSDHVQRETVEVWIDANNPSRHYLDTSFLPEHASA